MKMFNSGSLKRTILLLVALVAVAFLTHLTQAPDRLLIPLKADPQTTYHLAWQLAGKSFYDQDKLGDWASWEHKYDGKLRTDEDADKAINEMLSTLHDRYTMFIGAQAQVGWSQMVKGDFVGIGVAFGVQLDAAGNPVKGSDGQYMPAVGPHGLPLILAVLDGSPAEAYGVKAGDEIVGVATGSKDGAVTTPAKGLSVDALKKLIGGAQGTPVMLTVQRKDQQVQVLLVRQDFEIRAVHYKVLDGNVGYIKIDDFMNSRMLNQLADALQHLKGCRGLILDLRNNPGGQVPNAIGAAQMFLNKGYIVHIKTREANGHLIEEDYSVLGDQFIYDALDDNDGDNVLQKSARQIPQLTKQPVVILVNGNSASAAEMFTGALHDNHRAVVVGAKTFGKGIGQSVFPMPNGAALHVTTLRYYTPDRTWLGDGTGEGLFAIGISPDVAVAADKSGEDTQLKAAQQELQALAAASK